MGVMVSPRESINTILAVINYMFLSVTVESEVFSLPKVTSSNTTCSVSWCHYPTLGICGTHGDLLIGGIEEDS